MSQLEYAGRAESPRRHAAIELSGVGVRIGQTRILEDISWSVPVGCDAAILGPNGSGKSTLIRLILGYLWPSEGQVSVLGEKFGDVELAALRRNVKLVHTGGGFDLDPELTLREIALTGFASTMVLRFEPTAEQNRRADDVLEIVGLAGLADRKYAAASTGERTRAQLARAIVAAPKLLVLDEPTAGLDLVGRERMLELVESLREKFDMPELTVLTVSHHTEELPSGTSQALVLDRGRAAAAGPTAQVLTSEVLSGIYGLPIRVHREGGRYFTVVSRR